MIDGKLVKAGDKHWLIAPQRVFHVGIRVPSAPTDGLKNVFEPTTSLHNYHFFSGAAPLSLFFFTSCGTPSSRLVSYHRFEFIGSSSSTNSGLPLASPKTATRSVHERRCSVHHATKWSLTDIAFWGILGAQMRDDALILVTPSIFNLHLSSYHTAALFHQRHHLDTPDLRQLHHDVSFKCTLSLTTPSPVLIKYHASAETKLSQLGPRPAPL